MRLSSLSILPLIRAAFYILPDRNEDMLNEIEDENLYRALLTVDKRTLQIVLLKMQGYSLKEIAPMVDLSAGAVYARLDHLRKKLRKLL